MLYPFKLNLRPSSRSEYEVCSFFRFNSSAYAVLSDVPVNLLYSTLWPSLSLKIPVEVSL